MLRRYRRTKEVSDLAFALAKAAELMRSLRQQRLTELPLLLATIFGESWSAARPPILVLLSSKDLPLGRQLGGRTPPRSKLLSVLELVGIHYPLMMHKNPGLARVLGWEARPVARLLAEAYCSTVEATPAEEVFFAGLADDISAVDEGSGLRYAAKLYQAISDALVGVDNFKPDLTAAVTFSAIMAESMSGFSEAVERHT
jgi:hypothetical protein